MAKATRADDSSGKTAKASCPPAPESGFRSTFFFF